MSEETVCFRQLCQQTPIIPAMRRPELAAEAAAAQGRLVYLLAGDPETCEPAFRTLLAAGKIPLVNLDLLNGFSRDRHAVNFLKRLGARGILSTHLDPLRHARSLGLYAVQRTFLLDSGAMEAICNQLKASTVDALEVLPALAAPKLLRRIGARDLPIVGGGLVESMKEAEQLLAQGLSAISISDPTMWLR